MDLLYSIDWQSMWVPTQSALEVIFRGTVMYLGMFTLLRVFRRQSGQISMSDLLVIVVIADAAQNGMAGQSKSVVEALLLVGTIIFWDWMIDMLGFKSVLMNRILEAQPLTLVKNGRIIKKNLDSEMLTKDELLGQLRLEGVENLRQVKQCCLEANGRFSVILVDDDAKDGNKTDSADVN